MRPRNAAIIAVAISLAIRLLLLTQAAGVSLDAYHTLLHADHIADTGLPLGETQLLWGGAELAAPPLLPYLIAFFSILFDTAFVGLILPNLAAALTPIPIMLLAREATKNEHAISTATLASSFLPLLYATTTIAATPLALALPLLLLSYYYFLRLAKTPRDQIAYVITTTLLAFTHPIALALPVMMIATLIIVRVQRTPLTRSMAEATLFTAVLTLWAALIIHKPLINNAGINVLFAHTPPIAPAEFIALAGVLPLSGAAIATAHYFREERNLAVHALTGAAGTIAVLQLFRLVRPEAGILVLSAFVTVLAAPAITILLGMREHSRMRFLHTTGYLFLAVMFILTSMIPAVGLGQAALATAPGPEERAVLTALVEAKNVNTIHWDAAHGAFLAYAGLNSVTDTRTASNPESQRILADLESINEAKSEVSIIETLNAYNVDAIVLPQNHELPLNERCFEPLMKNSYEVYRLRCVVQ